MLIFNDKAVIAVGIGVLIGMLAGFSTHIPTVGVITAFVVPIGIDVWMRFNSEDCERPMIDPNAGAHIWFAPVWFVAIIVMIVIGLAYSGIV